MVICLERGADLHMVQLVPLPLAVSCFSKIQTGFTFLVKRPVECVCSWMLYTEVVSAVHCVAAYFCWCSTVSKILPVYWTTCRSRLPRRRFAGCFEFFLYIFTQQRIDANQYKHRHTHTSLTALFPGLPRWASTRKVKPVWILLKQETVGGSGNSWAVCKSAPRSRQITTPAPTAVNLISI